MFKKVIYTTCILLGLTLTTGCASKSQHTNAANQNVQGANLELVVVRVNGYGTAAGTGSNLSASQKRLLAMRASKMDAYRALAERVHGTRIQGSTTVSNLVTTDDQLRAYVDNLVRDARVSSVKELKDGTFETQVELILEPRIQRCLLEGNASDPICRPMTVISEGSHSTTGRPTSRYHLD